MAYGKSASLLTDGKLCYRWIEDCQRWSAPSLQLIGSPYYDLEADELLCRVADLSGKLQPEPIPARLLHPVPALPPSIRPGFAHVIPDCLAPSHWGAWIPAGTLVPYWRPHPGGSEAPGGQAQGRAPVAPKGLERHWASFI